ncbi:bifunctional fructose-bisphosphatase/inositol-phosphate phosphatase [Methanobacterium oryzae]|uniref:bifunctional fructose-bisphosphatase/inositol-phosphate phosphatase n=1 Tax=Methanobacterium oryzae TaxID=69540 RepID=UPI003D1BA298
MEMEDTDFWRNVSYQIINEVEKAISPFIGEKKSGENVKMGADGTPTKLIDEIAEEKVIEVLKSCGKSVILVSEEIGELKIGDGNVEAIFIVDPLDGTVNAIKNIPAYAISIAIAFSNKSTHLTSINDVKMGFVKNLATGDIYEAIKGIGAYVNGENVTPSSQEKVSGSSIGAYIRGSKAWKMNELFNIVRRIRLLGSVAIELCYVANGTYDAFLDIRGNLRIVDIAAAKLIIEESGGIVTDENGEQLNNKLNVKERTSIIASCNFNIHKDLMRILGVL